MKAELRPFKPEFLKEYLKGELRRYTSWNCSPAQRGICVGLISKCFDGKTVARDMRRHMITKYLTGYASMKASVMPAEWIFVLLKHISPDGDGIDPMALKEFRQVYSMLHKDSQKQVLFKGGVDGNSRIQD